MLQRIGVSRGSGNAEGKRKQVSWEGTQVLSEGAGDMWLVLCGYLCDQKIHDTQTGLLVLTPPLQVVIRFTFSYLLALVLAQATDTSPP